MSYKKKLIEVALPLEAINRACARENAGRHGQPKSLHAWWSRKPLSAAKAILFAQLVDDPSSCPELFPSSESQARERLRLFRILEDLIDPDRSNDLRVLESARVEIRKSWARAADKNAENVAIMPAFHDPFAGGGALPLEAQRLGLEAYATDLNPVAVLINKAMIEVPPIFAGFSPVHPAAALTPALFDKQWRGAEGLAVDIRSYGHWIRTQAESQLGHLYPEATVSHELAVKRPDLRRYEGKSLRVIAWIWARTVLSPNPVFSGCQVPLVSSYILSSKPGKEAFVEPIVTGKEYIFDVRIGRPDDPEAAKLGTKLGRGSNFSCILSKAPITEKYIKAEGQAGRIGTRLMAIVAEGESGRVYLPPDSSHEFAANAAKPNWTPDGAVPARLTGGTCVPYGLRKWGDLFTARQLTVLDAFARLIGEVVEVVAGDASKAWRDRKDTSGDLNERAQAYGKSVALYLALALSKHADLSNSLCRWEPAAQCPRQLFARQAIPMIWHFAEGNPFGTSSGSWDVTVKGSTRAFESYFNYQAPDIPGHAQQANAVSQASLAGKIISTDPPYYDNIGYSDIADFFYVWLRRALKPVLPGSDLFSTVTTPKVDELVASAHRHGGATEAKTHFLNNMTKAMSALREAHPAFPVTIYYAYKQSESTGWETFLSALLGGGFQIVGTWPVETETANRMANQGTNSMASSIVLVCRQRAQTAPTVSRREFLQELRRELPEALRYLQGSNIAPSDLDQAALGPGMAVYSRYAKVLDSEGNALGVGDALALINETLDLIKAEPEADLDSETRWAIVWFEENGFNDGQFGSAEKVSKAKNTSIKGLEDAGILVARAGKVRLLRPDELQGSWDPTTDCRLSVWEMVHHLVRVLEGPGESAAAELVAKLGTQAEVARELCYRLYTICERKKRANEALSYNNLVQSWPEITRLARERQSVEPEQGVLF